MSETSRDAGRADPAEAFRAENPLRREAVILEGVTDGGKPCHIIDNTASVDRREPQALLNDLIREKRFGLHGFSAAGGNTVKLGAPSLPMSSSAVSCTVSSCFLTRHASSVSDGTRSPQA